MHSACANWNRLSFMKACNTENASVSNTTWVLLSSLHLMVCAEWILASTPFSFAVGQCMPVDIASVFNLPVIVYSIDMSSFQTHIEEKKTTLKDFIFWTVQNVVWFLFIIPKTIKHTSIDIINVWFEDIKGVIRGRYS